MELTVEPHDAIEVVIECTLNPELLGPWEDLSNEAKDMYLDGTVGPLHCDGQGDPSGWCTVCKYGIVEE